MRLGLFGGSFDPVHLGHLELARSCRQQARLDEVWFVPAATQPFKQHGPAASDADRLAMLRLATADESAFRVCSIEIDRGGVSYTVDTLRQVHAERPDAELYFLLGADALRDLPTWREPEAICGLATPLVVARAGEPAPDFQPLLTICPPERVEAIRAAQVTMPAMPISSSAIRAAIAAGQSAAEWLPSMVWGYITEYGLYAAGRPEGTEGVG